MVYYTYRSRDIEHPLFSDFYQNVRVTVFDSLMLFGLVAGLQVRALAHRAFSYLCASRPAPRLGT